MRLLPLGHALTFPGGLWPYTRPSQWVNLCSRPHSKVCGATTRCSRKSIKEATLCNDHYCHVYEKKKVNKRYLCVRQRYITGRCLVKSLLHHREHFTALPGGTNISPSTGTLFACSLGHCEQGWCMNVLVKSFPPKHIVHTRLRNYTHRSLQDAVHMFQGVRTQLGHGTESCLILFYQPKWREHLRKVT